MTAQLLKVKMQVMRITLTEVQEGVVKESDIDTALQRLVALSNRLDSAYWGKMLILMRHLASHGPEIELHGHILLKQIHLSRWATHNPELLNKLNEHMKRWKAENSEAQSGGAISRESSLRALREFWKLNQMPCGSATVRVDWRDYAPLHDGIPEMHYRIEIKNRTVNQSVKETRTQDLTECERIFRAAFSDENGQNR